MRFSLILFSATLFLSAALTFAVQPMIGKMLLPLVGGAPAGWIVAMAFFQCMLLAGYLFAHILSRFTPRQQGLVYIASLLLGAMFLPAQITPETMENMGAVSILLLLTKTIGWPFIALSATSSTMQRLFTTTDHPHAKDPYFLYAASNLGSFGGLLLYPLVAEPFFGLHTQTYYWTVTYMLLVAFSSFCLLASKKKQEASSSLTPSKTQLPARLTLSWMMLAFFPSSLLLGVTTHITTDIFSAPMIWTMPLALYLLTFVIAFARKPVISLNAVARAQPAVVLLAVAASLVTMPTVLSISWYAVFAHLLIFTIVALTCHLRLAVLRPLDDIRHLTVFYLMISVGGALGGIFNAFIAPVIFKTPVEYPLMLALSLLANPFIKSPMNAKLKAFTVIAGICGIIVVAIMSGLFKGHFEEEKMLLAAALVATMVILSVWHARMAFAFACLLLIAGFSVSSTGIVTRDRNFYGVVKVYEHKIDIDGKEYTSRVIQHGTTNHGLQIMDDQFKDKPVAYYIDGSPVSDVFKQLKPKDIAIIGLGAGALNCFAKNDSAFTFIEIDPAVVSIAQKNFTYLKDCPGRQEPELITGDGRIELARLPADRKFDLILLDAFTSDAIPLHLLTLEAMQSYLDRLKPGGLILFHISNRYFNLAPVLAKTAHALELTNRWRAYDPDKKSEYKMPSIWMIAGRVDDAGMKALAPYTEDQDWLIIPPLPHTKIWTDDYTYLLGTIRNNAF